MRDDVIKWLLDSEPWIQYGAMSELLGQDENAPEVAAAREQMIDFPPLKSIVEELKNWPGAVLSSHKSAKQPFHKLSFIAELGFDIKVPGISNILDKVMENISPEGVIRLPLNIGEAYGGTGKDTWGWALCDAPINLYAAAKLGLKDDSRIKNGVHNLASLVRENGWPCAVSEELGSWRGPGKKNDPCPYATLAMLKLLSLYEDYQNGAQVRAGIDCLCQLWSESQRAHPYIFYMGNDFRKLKAPLIWYDIVHVLDVLSRFAYAKTKPQVRQMLDTVIAKMDGAGCFTPESVYMEFKGWDFGQKIKPSKYLTFLVYRILKRIEYVIVRDIRDSKGFLKGMDSIIERDGDRY